MNALEDRLRTELRTEARLVAPESIPALSLPGPDGRQLAAPRRGGARRWPAWVLPAAAAAAVTAVIAGTLTVARVVSGGAPHGHAAGASYSRLPPYYAATVEGSVLSYTWKGTQYGSMVLGRSIKIRATSTGTLVATVRPPAPYNNFMLLAGSADGRTFVFGAERYWGFRGHGNPQGGALDPSAPVRFVMLRISPDGHVHLSALSLPFALLPGQEPSIALSPDGARLAVAYGGGGQAALVRVVTLATGEERQWQWPGAAWTPLLQGPGAWTADGRTLVLQQWYVIRSPDGKAPPSPPAGTTPVWLIDTAAPGSGPARKLLLLRAPAGLSAPWQPFITPDGSELAATVSKRTGGLAGGRSSGELAVFSAQTGALMRTAAPWTWSRAGRARGPLLPSPAIAWSDYSGRQLLVIQPRDGTSRLGVLTGNTVVLSGSSLLPSQPDGYTALQSTLRGAFGIPPAMTW